MAATTGKALLTMTAPMTKLLSGPRTAIAEFAAFLRRPQVLKPGGWRAPGNLRRWAWLTALLVVVLIGLLLPLLRVWQEAFGLPSPDAFGALQPAVLVPVVVLVAPVIEELLFRGWQSGRAAALWLLGCALVAAAALLLGGTPSRALLALGLLVAAAIAALAGWLKLRRRAAPIGWFAGRFPAIFYITAAGFALVHLGNYPRLSLAALPLVLPQLWAALVLGYLRQRIGLTGSIAAHITANACTIALALAAG